MVPLKRFPFTVMILGICAGFALLTSISHAQWPEGPLKIVNINVGQGSATLILGPASNSGKRISVLMDAGPVTDKGQDVGQRVATVLAEHGVRKLDVFITTHYDPEHLGGLISGGPLGKSLMYGPDGEPGTADDINITNFIDRGDISDMERHTRNHTFEEYQDVLGTAKATRHSIRHNDLMLNTKHCNRAITTQDKVNCFNIDLGDGAYMETLSSNGFIRNGKRQHPHTSSENERSLSFLLTYKRFNYYLGGDISGRDATLSLMTEDNARLEKYIGKYIQKKGVFVDVLNVNDSGSKSASNRSFLKKVRPKIAVISVGANKHGLPTKGALKRLVEVGIHRIYQTSRGRTRSPLPLEISQRQEFVNNHVVISTDGETYLVGEDRYKTNR